MMINIPGDQLSVRNRIDSTDTQQQTSRRAITEEQQARLLVVVSRLLDLPCICRTHGEAFEVESSAIARDKQGKMHAMRS